MHQPTNRNYNLVVARVCWTVELLFTWLPILYSVHPGVKCMFVPDVVKVVPVSQGDVRSQWLWPLATKMTALRCLYTCQFLRATCEVEIFRFSLFLTEPRKRNVSASSIYAKITRPAVSYSILKDATLVTVLLYSYKTTISQNTGIFL